MESTIILEPYERYEHREEGRLKKVEYYDRNMQLRQASELLVDETSKEYIINVVFRENLVKFVSINRGNGAVESMSFYKSGVMSRHSNFRYPGGPGTKTGYIVYFYEDGSIKEEFAHNYGHITLHQTYEKGSFV
jgi:antitoxin component YwqK of YwqJK toxin-antitoxin module